MRILEVSNFFKPSWETGGVTKVNYELSKQLVARGHDVTVYTTDGYSSRLKVPKNQPVEVDGIKVYYFYSLSRFLVKKMKLPIPFYLPFVIRKQIKEFDIIHIHEHRTLSAAVVYYYAKKYGVPYVLQSHGSVLPFMQKQKLKELFDFLLGYNILKNATKTIALNEDEVSQYQQMRIDKNNIEIVPNGINLDEYKNVPIIGTFKKMYNISETEKIILYVGRVHKSKGIDLLIEALPLVLNKIPSTRLIIIGPDNGFQHELENLAKKLHVEKNVIFTGFVEKSTKVAALIDADVFVTPSYSGFPISFLEACVFGLPIVTTFKGDNLNWINNKVGYVVEYDKNKFSNVVVDILIDSRLAKLLGDNARNISKNRFSIEHTLNKIESIYFSIVETTVDN